jgi:hypothetical protein
MNEFVVSIHDVAPATAERCRRWVELCEARGIRTSLLVVPGPWQGLDWKRAPGFVEWLVQKREDGHEIVQHGFRHERITSHSTTTTREIFGRLMARGAEEFWHLDERTAIELLSAGRRVLQEHGLTAEGFVAPGWLLSVGARSALSKCEFSYTCVHRGVIDLRTGRLHSGLSSSQRPGSWASGIGRLWNRVVLDLTARRGSFARIAIHPRDLGEQALRSANLSYLDRLVGDGWTPTTYGRFVESRRTAMGRSVRGES